VPSLLKKTMVYLGLLDDEYDEYDEYDDRGKKSSSPIPRVDKRVVEPEEPELRATTALPRIRPIPRDNGSGSGSGSGSVITPAAVRPQSAADALGKVHVVAPARFGDAKEIADCLIASRPVIVNLQIADRDLQRRMIDFCSGVTYALSGEMEKVAEQVFLLAPTNVKVSDEERQRLQERNFGRR